MNKRAWLVGLCMWLAIFSSVPAKAVLNANDPVEFFTTVADKLLHNTFNFGVTNIPVYSNGVCVYSPAVQRLLQVSANVYDATTTNFFPSVFRPLFSQDASNNIFISGYEEVTNVSGPNDPQLAIPITLGGLSKALTSDASIGGADAPVNVYGVPWIIGVKKGFPNFNKLGMQTIIQISRELQVGRQNAAGPYPSIPDFVFTNQLYMFSISNTIGIDCWNSYSNAYPNPVEIQVQDVVSMYLTNDCGLPPVDFPGYPITTNLTVNSWPGYASGSTSSFVVPLEQPLVLLTNSFLYFGSAPPGLQGFYPATAFYGWETNRTTFDLPHFGLLTTNCLQLVMLDLSSNAYHVIDYVQLAGPERYLDINAAFQTNSVVQGYNNMWATNVAAQGIPYGILNQLLVSEGQIPLNSIYWSATLPPVGGVSPQDLINGFCSFMGVVSPYPDSVLPYYLTNSVVRVPYTPTVTISDYSSYQANDPLIHYLASDLVYGGRENGNNLSAGVTVSQQNQNVLAAPVYNMVNARYQPWGVSALPSGVLFANQSGYDTNYFNLGYRDPLVWRSDGWNFPTNWCSIIDGLGQIHRGTPWQTLYLKADNILTNTVFGPSTGTNTWMAWTGDFNATDAALMAPVNDWKLAALLTALLNTNDPTQLMSVNDSSDSDWQKSLDGLNVYSNSLSLPAFLLPWPLEPFPTPAFDTYVMTSNSPAAWAIATGIIQAKASQPNGYFYSIGDILAVAELTEASPWLNASNVNQLRDGITDAAYEAIPNQLLWRLRPDSIGAVSSTNGGWMFRFSGSDAYTYVLQTSTNLVNWKSISTNCPVDGSFGVFIPSGQSAGCFYRTLLVR